MEVVARVQGASPPRFIVRQAPEREDRDVPLGDRRTH